MTYLIDNSVDFLLVACGIGIILYCAGTFIPHPLKFISEIVNTLIDEFTNYRTNLTVEKVNAIIVILFFLLAIMTGLFELGPSAFKQALGFEAGGEVKVRYFTPCLVGMFVSGIGSPVWIMIMKREQHLRRKAKEDLKGCKK